LPRIRVFRCKAIVRNLFKGAIEAGDATVVKLLLQDSAANIDPNTEVCHVSALKFTPIERASALRHEGVADTLLQYHVDVNKIYDNVCRLEPALTCLHGALAYATCDSMKFAKYEKVNRDIFGMLLNAGGNVSHQELMRMIEQHDDEYVVRIMRARIQENHEMWNKKGVSGPAAFQLLRVDTCKEIVQLMVDARANLNCKDVTRD
jgi:hypothetical protein